MIGLAHEARQAAVGRAPALPGTPWPRPDPARPAQRCRPPPSREIGTGAQPSISGSSASTRVLVHVRDVEHRLHGEQVQLVDGRDARPRSAPACGRDGPRSGRRAPCCAASSFAAPDLSRLASFSRRGMAFSTVAMIGQNELGLDGVHVATADPPARPRGHDVRIAEEAHHLGRWHRSRGCWRGTGCPGPPLGSRRPPNRRCPRTPPWPARSSPDGRFRPAPAGASSGTGTMPTLGSMVANG